MPKQIGSWQLVTQLALSMVWISPLDEFERCTDMMQIKWLAVADS
jgi:hypothetical protein